MVVAGKKPPAPPVAASPAQAKRKRAGTVSKNLPAAAPPPAVKQESAEPLSIGDLSIEILQDLIRSMTHEVAARAIQLEHKIRAQYGPEFVARPYNTALPPGIRAKSAQKTEVVGRVAYLSSPWSSQAGTPVAGSAPGTPRPAAPAVPVPVVVVVKEENAEAPADTVKLPGSGATSRKGTPTPAGATPSASLLEDMYGIEKSSEPRYFECLNCTRKIAGSRFAAHLERCLGGRNSRHKDRKSAVASASYGSLAAADAAAYTSPSPSSAAADFSSAASSPAKSQLGGGGDPAASTTATVATSTNSASGLSSATANGSSSGGAAQAAAAGGRPKKRKIGMGAAAASASTGPAKTAVSKFLDRGAAAANGGGAGAGGGVDGGAGSHSAPSSPRLGGGAALAGDKFRSHSEEPSVHPRKRARDT